MQVYGPRRRARPSPEAMLNQLTEMGFDAESATQALRRFGNMDLALAFLLSGGGMRGAAQQHPGPAPERSADQAAGPAAQQAADASAAVQSHAQQPVEAAGRMQGDGDTGVRRASAPNTPIPAHGDASDDQSMHDAEDDGAALTMEHGSGDADEPDDVSWPRQQPHVTPVYTQGTRGTTAQMQCPCVGLHVIVARRFKHLRPHADCCAP